MIMSLRKKEMKRKKRKRERKKGGNRLSVQKKNTKISLETVTEMLKKTLRIFFQEGGTPPTF